MFHRCEGYCNWSRESSTKQEWLKSHAFKLNSQLEGLKLEATTTADATSYDGLFQHLQDGKRIKNEVISYPRGNPGFDLSRYFDTEDGKGVMLCCQYRYSHPDANEPLTIEQIKRMHHCMASGMSPPLLLLLSSLTH